MGAAKLYRDTAEGVEYWESWVHDGKAVVHYGKLGERGTMEEFSSLSEFADYLGPKSDELHAAGYRNVPEEEHEIVLAQWPRDVVPRDIDEMEALWDRIERWVNEELGWTGLGRCVGVDLSTELVAIAEVVDVDLAVKVLATALMQSDLPTRGIIAVRIDDERDEIRWPPERAGEDVSEGLPPG